MPSDSLVTSGSHGSCSSGYQGGRDRQPAHPLTLSAGVLAETGLWGPGGCPAFPRCSLKDAPSTFPHLTCSSMAMFMESTLVMF